MIALDTLTIDAATTRTTAEGYLAVRAKTARSGVYEYLGSEVDPTGEHGFRASDTVRVYRAPEEVFDAKAVHSFLMKPITDNHPSEPVTADNWKRHAKGVVAGAMRDGEYLAFDLVLMDRDMIQSVKDGKRELSAGYSTDVKFEGGKSPSGEEYDALQIDIRGNHVATVRTGRAGSECRIADSVALCDSADRNMVTDLLDGAKTVDPMKIVRDGVTIEVNDAFIASLDKKIITLTADIEKLRTDHAAEIAAADAKLGKAEAERDAALGKVMDAAALDKAVTERADLISTARAIHDADYTGKSAADIRKAVLVAKGVAIDGKSDAYIDARFDVLAEDAKSAGRVVDAIRDGTGKAQPYTYQATVDAANQAAVDLNSWREKKA